MFVWIQTVAEDIVKKSVKYDDWEICQGQQLLSPDDELQHQVLHKN